MIDALVVGGGPAGLTAALYLARFRRRVVVVDAGASRAARIPCSRNVAGFPDGVAGAELVAAMRGHAQRYGAELVHDEVMALERGADGFAAVLERGAPLRAHNVVLATGCRDVAPRMPQLQRALADGLLRYCPVCDGYEVIDRRVGLLADSERDLGEALYLRHFTPQLTVFRVSAAVRFDAAQRERLAGAGIGLVEAPVDALVLEEGGVRVQHGSASTRLDALYSALGLQPHAGLAAALGAECAADGTLVTDRHQQTGVPGLYAAGDVAKGLNQISVAMGDAAIAAAAMHRALLDAEHR